MNMPNMTSHKVEKPKYLRHFASYELISDAREGKGTHVYSLETYGEEYIHDVHQHEDQHPNWSEVVAVRRSHERNGDEMMSEHLPVVFATLFDVND
jgi:hypothetical protein